MKLLNGLILSFLSIVILTGCSYIKTPSYIQNQDKKFLNAKTIPPLRVPPGIASSAFQNFYPVSDRQYPQGSLYPSLLPPGLNSEQ